MNLKKILTLAIYIFVLIFAYIILPSQQKQKELTFKVKVEYVTQDDYNKWIISIAMWSDAFFMPVYIVEDTARYNYHWQIPYSFNTKEEAIAVAKQFTGRKMYEHFKDSVDIRTDFLNDRDRPKGTPPKNYYNDTIIFVKKEMINVYK